MRKIVLLLVIILAIPIQSFAENRTEQQMKVAATNALLSHQGNHSKSRGDNEIKELMALSKLRVYGYDNGGFAVVTSDDRFESVIGVSSSQFTKSLPCGFKWWLETVNENMQKGIVSNSTRAKSRGPQNTSVAPLITTTWGQGRPYNDNCKYTHGDDTYQCVTGCVATALAQIMNFYRHPTTGTGSCSYDVTYNNEYTITYSEDFSQSTYDWDNMLDSYDAYYNTTTVDAHTQAVAKLMKDCGVACKMQYSVQESGATLIDAEYALKNYFSYSSSTKYYYRGDYGKDDWLNIIYHELDNGRPILYGGALDDNGTDGHAFVLNGYDSSGNIYINWGWEGNFDGYFDIDLLNPSTHQFNSAQGMIVIIPSFGMHTLSISASGLGKVNYGSADGMMIRDKAKDFIVKDGNSVTLFFTPDSERELNSVTINGTDVTSDISNNQYTISNISADISVVVSFETSTNADDVVINSTNFPDENFQNWILNNIEAAKDGVLTASEMESITYIDCSGQQIQSLKGIENFTSLDNLYCQFNQLSSLDVSRNTNLTSLSCYQNQLTSLNLGEITTLTGLSCGENQLTTLDVSKNTSINILQCQDNQLKSLNLGEISTLTDLFICSRNQLTSLDVSKNISLQYFDCGGNQLTSIDVSNNTALILFDCRDNRIASLDVSMNIALENLNCSNNKLSSLDVSNNTALRGLAFDDNKIAFIDVSHAPNLTTLACMKNQLTSLDVSNNTALTYLVCNVNLLTDLDLRNNTNLTYLRCELNQLYDLDLSKNTLLSSDSENSPQYADITYDYINGLNVEFHYVSIRALDIPEGIAIPVPSTFDISKVSDLMLDGTAVQGSIVNKNGLKFLVFAESGINPSCQMMLSYSYDTGNSTVGLMTVNVPITYTGTATVWTDPDTNHSWVYSSSDANASIDRNAWAAGDITVPSIINGNTVNNIDYKAFYGCSGMTSLTIPSTITHMCDYVVNGCHKLKKLIVMATIPPAISDVTFIDYDIPLYVPDDVVDTYKNTATWKNFKNIRALSTVNQHDLIYKVDGETYKTYTLNKGDNIISESAPTKEGYNFSGWDEIPAVMPDYDVTVTGSFTPINYAITYELNGGILAEDVTNPPTYTIESETFTLNNPMREGYTFAGWTGTGLSETSAVVTITKGSKDARAYTANWKKLLTNGITVESIADQIYKGGGIEPTVIVKDGEIIITNDCNVVFTDNTIVGIATVTITAKAKSTSYDGEMTITFKIIPKTVGLSWSETTTFDCDDTEKTITAIATGLEAEDVCNVIISDNKATEVGNYIATITALDNANYQLPTTGLTCNYEIVRKMENLFNGSSYWTGYVAQEDLDLPTGLTAYTVTSLGTESAIATSLDYIPKDEPVLLTRTDTEVNLYRASAGTGTASNDNMLQIASATNQPTAFRDYVLYKDAFVLVNGGTLADGKVFLRVPQDNLSRASVYPIAINGDNATIIKSLFDDQSHDLYDQWYTIEGRKLDGKPTKKGLYIHNGKKEVVK